MAISRLSLPSALCLISLLLAPITAHKPKPPAVTVYTTITDCGVQTSTLPTVTVPTGEPPTSCLTITSTTTPATCGPLESCSMIPCPAIAMMATQPCGCPSAIPTVYEPTGCCPGCIVPTFATTATDCPTTTPPPPPPCAVVTSKAPPACPSISGCPVPDCIYLETLTMGCDCSGVSTVTECNGKCPGCLTQYETLNVPCTTGPPK